MKTDIPVDFSFSFMSAQRAMKNLHEAMLEKQYPEAKESAIEALVELKLTLNAINEEAEKWNQINSTHQA